MIRAVRKAVKRPAVAARRTAVRRAGQIGLSSTSRMNAARAQPAQQRQLDRAGGARAVRRRPGRRPARGRPRRPRLGQAEQDLEDELAHQRLAPALERADQGHVVGVLEVAADRQAAGDPGDRRRRRPSSRSARYIAVASPSSVGLVARMTSSNGSPSRVGLVDALEELADLEPLGADAVDRADRAVEHVVAAAELAGPLDGQDVERLLDDAQPARRRGRGRGRSGTAARR